MEYNHHQDNLDLTQGKSNTKEEIEKLLKDAFADGSFKIASFTGGEHNHIHLEVHVDCPRFKNLPLLEQHRMVTFALKPKMDKIHAVIIKTSCNF